MDKQKKIKAQVPYRLFLWLNKKARDERRRASDVIKEIIEERIGHCVLSPKIMPEKLLLWTRQVRCTSPNNIHFMTDESLEQVLLAFKVHNCLISDSETIRAILAEAYQESQEYSGPTLFDNLQEEETEEIYA